MLPVRFPSPLRILTSNSSPLKIGRVSISILRIVIKIGQPWPLFGFIIAKLCTNSITTDVVTINWACPCLAYEACLHVRDLLNKGVQGRFAPLLRHAAEAARPNLNMLKKGMALHRGSIQALHPAVQCSNIGTPEAFVVKLWA